MEKARKTTKILLELDGSWRRWTKLASCHDATVSKRSKNKHYHAQRHEPTTRAENEIGVRPTTSGVTSGNGRLVLTMT